MKVVNRHCGHNEAIQSMGGLLRMLCLLAMMAVFCLPQVARAQDIDTGLVAHWTFDGDSGSTITDQSGNGNDGVWADGGDDDIAGEIVSGVNGDALRFTANANIQASIFPTGASAPYTVAVWINPYGLGGGGQNILWRAGPDPATCQNGPKVTKEFVSGNYILNADNQCGNDAASEQYFYHGQWYHVVSTYDGTNLSFYVNGTLQETVASSYSGTDPQAADFYLGSATGASLLADMDELRLYNRALTPEDVRAIYDLRSGFIRFNADYRVPEYYNGDAWVAMGETKYIPHAVAFDGVSDKLTGNGLSSNSKRITGSLWFRRTGGLGSTQVIYSEINASFRVSIQNGGEIEFRGNDASLTNILQVTTTAAIVDTDWHHLAFSFDMEDNTKTRIFIDDANAAYTESLFVDAPFRLQDNENIGSNSDDSLIMTAELSDFWLAGDVYLDFAEEANRRKFIDEDGDPVDLGSDGSTPTGNAPDIFLSGDIANWHTNKGAGGGYTENGEILISGMMVDLSPPVVTRTSLDIDANTSGFGDPALDRHSVYVMGSGANSDGLRIYDVSDPENPTLQYHLNDPAINAASFDISYPYIYFLSAGSNILTTYNITDPTNPVYEGAGSIVPPSPQRGFYARDGFLFIAYSHGLYSFDVTDPNNPITADTFGPVTNCGGACQVLGDGYMYRAVDGPALQVLDVTDPYNITLALTDNAYTEAHTSRPPAIMGDKLVLFGASSTLASYILDISNPASPTLIGRSTIPLLNGYTNDDRYLIGQDGSGTNVLGHVFSMDVDGNLTRIYETDVLPYPRMMRPGHLYNGRYTYAAPYCCGAPAADLMVIDLATCADPKRMAGSIIYNADSQVMQYCDGKNWQAMGAFGSGSGGCSNPTRPEGSMIYNRDSAVMQYCEGDEWVQVGEKPDPCVVASPTIGITCNDGTIYAGLSPDGNVKMYTTPNDEAVNLAWSNLTVVTGLTDQDTGQANQATAEATLDLNDYPAFKACADANFAGYNDWYLPARNENAVLYDNRVAIGNFQANGRFWSSSEVSGTNASFYNHQTGFQGSQLKTDATNFQVRCVRKN